jgi:hypothetical protein
MRKKYLALKKKTLSVRGKKAQDTGEWAFALPFWQFDADVFENASVGSKNVVTSRSYDVAFSFHSTLKKKPLGEREKKMQGSRGWAFCLAILACQSISSMAVLGNCIGAAFGWFHQKVRLVGFSVCRKFWHSCRIGSCCC